MPPSPAPLRSPATRRQLVLLVLATLGAGVIGLAATFIGLLMVDAGLYKSVNLFSAALAGAVSGVIACLPLAVWMRSWWVSAFALVVLSVQLTTLPVDDCPHVSALSLSVALEQLR